VGCESRRYLFSGGRPEVVKAQAVPCDPSQQSTVRGGAVSALVLAGAITMWIDGPPVRPPQGIQSRNIVQAEFANVPASRKHGNVSPLSADTPSTAYVQEISQSDDAVLCSLGGH